MHTHARLVTHNRLRRIFFFLIPSPSSLMSDLCCEEEEKYPDGPSVKLHCAQLILVPSSRYKSPQAYLTLSLSHTPAF